MDLVQFFGKLLHQWTPLGAGNVSSLSCNAENSCIDSVHHKLFFPFFFFFFFQIQALQSIIFKHQVFLRVEYKIKLQQDTAWDYIIACNNRAAMSDCWS